MDSPAVTLVVKTPNQKIQDLHIACALEWTVKQLKGHISSVYPTKPESENQKLIYSGQLLRDQLLLKDVLREHEEGKSHTFHLVCSVETGTDHSRTVMDTDKPSNASTPPTPSTPTQTQATPQIPPSHYDGLRYRGTNTGPLNYPLHYMYHQQMMQAATRQGQMPGNLYQVPPMVPPPYWMQMMAQQAAAGRLPMPTQLFNHPANFAHPQMLHPWFPQARNIHEMPAMPPSPIAQEQQMHHQPNPVQAAPQQARQQQANRNMQANANVDPAFDADEDEDNLNQDWLDKIYTLCRIGILLSIVWFYSTTGRFVMLMVFMILVCLYQNGVFQYFLRNRNNQVHNPEQHQQQGQGAPQAEQDGREANGSQGSSSSSGEDEAGEDEDGNESESMSNNENTEAPTQTTPARPSTLVVAFNFITTFFTSLVPRGDPVVGQN